MISLNIEREMKLEALAKLFLYQDIFHKTQAISLAKEVLDLLDSIDLSTQEAWMAEEKVREAELSLCYTRESGEGPDIAPLVSKENK